MKLIDINITAFGKYQNEKIVLTDGLNVIHVDDEDSKATITAFIFAMLFGIEKPKLNDRNDLYSTYMPWDNSERYGGSIVFEHGGKTYRLTRNFSDKYANTELYCLTDNEIVDGGANAFNKMILGSFQSKDGKEEGSESAEESLINTIIERPLSEEEKKTKAAIDKLVDEIQVSSEKLAELESRGHKLKAKTDYEKEEKSYKAYKAKYQQLLQDEEASEQKKKDAVEKEVQLQSLKISSDIPEPKGNYSLSYGLFSASVILLAVSITLFVLGKAGIGAAFIVIALLLGGAGAYLYSKTSAGIDKLKAERTYRIQEVLLEKRKDIKDEVEKSFLAEEREFAAREQEIFQYFSRFGNLEKLGPKELEEQESRLLEEKEELDQRRSVLGKMISEQGEKVLMLRIKLDEHEKAAQAAGSTETDGGYEKAQKFAENSKLVDQYIREVKSKHGSISQMKMAMRMAISELVHYKFETPLFFDDVFEYLDDARMKRTVEQICDYNGQKIVLCFNNRIEAFLNELSVDKKRVIYL